MTSPRDDSSPRPPRERPLVLRPRRLLVVAICFAVALLALTAYGWWALPRSIRVLFTLSQRLTLLAVLGLLVLVMFALALSVVRADATGLRFRNGLRWHTVPWDRVHAIMLRRGDPWAFVLLRPADGTPFTADLDAEKRQLMGIQANDGPRARAAVTELRARQERYQSGR